MNLTSFPVPSFPAMAAAVGALVLTSCAATSQQPVPQDGPQSSHFAFQFVHSDTELDEVELDQGLLNLDVPLERERVEARFGFGPERTRGKFFFFGESFDQSLGFNFAPNVETDVTVFGLGGGMSGAPVVGGNLGGDPQAPSFIIPYSWDVAFAYGDDEDAIFDTVAYGEIRASMGFGVEWQGLQPSVGVAASAISGVLDDDGFGDENDFSGFNVGAYGELRFAPPSTPVLLHVRAIAGDIDSIEFGFGVQV